MLLEALKSVVAFFRTSKDDAKARIDAAFTEHAAAIQDANLKLWTAIKDALDANATVADEVVTKAGEFEAYAVMLHEDAMRQRRELLDARARIAASLEESAAKIDLPPEPPTGEVTAEFTPVDPPATDERPASTDELPV